MRRIRFSCFLLSGYLALSAQTLLAAPPNVVFIFADDHAYQAISAYGSHRNQTPRIDRLAAEGMRFDRCLVTNSICGPSRATILTGKYSHHHGFFGNNETFDGSQTTFPKLLRAGGYQTAVVGKWHLKSEPTGFDFWQVLPGQGSYYNPKFRVPGGETTIDGYVTDVVTDLGLDWLEKGRDPGKPFFLMLQHKAPHRSWEPGPKQLTLFDDVDIPEPPTLFDDYEGRASPARNQRMTIAHHMDRYRDLKLWEPTRKGMARRKKTLRRLSDEQLARWDNAYGPKNERFRTAALQGDDLVRWKYQRYIKDYLRCIDSVDENVGRVLDYLDQTGLAKNTVVIYSSDQGFYLGEHGWFDKRWMYEESLRTPLLVRWPGIVAPGTVNRDITSNVDFAATFLEIAGLKSPNDLQGTSLVPLLRGSTPQDWRQSFYYHYYEAIGHGVPRHYGVATQRHKLIHYYEDGEWELFDRETDPHELRSLYGRPEVAALQRGLLRELERLRRQLGVPPRDNDAGRHPLYRPPPPLPPGNSIRPEVVVRDIAFAEGPAIDAAGNLYFVNFERRGTIGRRTPAGDVSLFVDLMDHLPVEGKREPRLNGLKVSDDGSLVGADVGTGNLVAVSKDGKQVEVLAHSVGGERLAGVNDLALDKKGNIYFTVPDQHRVCRFHRASGVTEVVVEIPTGRPNGVGVTPTGRYLLVNDSANLRTFIADLYDGDVRDLRELIDFKPRGTPDDLTPAARRRLRQHIGTPDGMIFDAHGRVYIALWEGGVVHAVTVPQGRIIETYKTGGRRTTNAHFHGGDLYVTVADLGQIVKLPLGVRGWKYSKGASE